MEKIIIFLTLLFMATSSYSADTKLTNLPDLDPMASTDTFYCVDDPTGSPVSSSCKVSTILTDTLIPNDLTITSTKALTATTVDTGNGATEIYDMDQDVKQADSVTFNALTLTTDLTVPNGGTGASTFTDGGILLGSGTDAITALGVATNGQIPIGDGVTDPVLATITGTADEIDVTNGAGSITLSLPATISADISGNAATVSTITGLAPDTATTAAAQPNITSLGTLTTLQVDNLNLNGNTFSSTAGTDLLITPLAGQQLILDGTMIIDAGVLTGATSITSTSFVGALTGNADTSTNATNHIANNGSDHSFIDQDVTSGSTPTFTGTNFTGIPATTGLTAGNWKVFYSNGSGVVTELTTGAAGTFLGGNGVTAAPSWSTPAGSGYVSKVGTPVDNQVGVWNGDGTIEGTNALWFNGTSLGIGTTNPSGYLDIEGGDVFIGTGTLTNGSASEDLSVTGNLEVDGSLYGDGSNLTGIITSVNYDDIGDPDADSTIAFGAYTNLWTSNETTADFFTIQNTANFGDISIVKIEETGNPTNGTMLEIVSTDTDVDAFLVNTSDFVIHGSGTVSIGTTASTAQLSVGGGAGSVSFTGTTADPCGVLPIGSTFYNSTSNYPCFCGAAGADLKMNDNTTACF
jgi:hypothetical protein